MQEESKTKIEEILEKIPEEMKREIDGCAFSSKPVGPSFFAMKVMDDSMDPEYSKGDIVIADPDAPWEYGDDCVVISRDGKEPPRLKMLEDEGDHIRLSSINRRHPDYAIRKDALKHFWICKVVSKIPGEEDSNVEEDNVVNTFGCLKWEGEETLEEIMECHIEPLEELCKIALKLTESALSSVNRRSVEEALKRVDLLLTEAKHYIGLMKEVWLRVTKDFERGRKVDTEKNLPAHLVNLTWLGGDTFHCLSSNGLLPLKSLFDIAGATLVDLWPDARSSTINSDVGCLTFLMNYISNRIWVLDSGIIDLALEYPDDTEKKAA